MRLMVVSHTYTESVNRSKWFVLRDIAPDLEILIITPTYWPDGDLGGGISSSVATTRLSFVPLKIWGRGYGSRYLFRTCTLC